MKIFELHLFDTGETASIVIDSFESAYSMEVGKTKVRSKNGHVYYVRESREEVLRLIATQGPSEEVIAAATRNAERGARDICGMFDRCFDHVDEEEPLEPTKTHRALIDKYDGLVDKFAGLTGKYVQLVDDHILLKSRKNNESINPTDGFFAGRTFTKQEVDQIESDFIKEIKGNLAALKTIAKGTTGLLRTKMSRGQMMKIAGEAVE